VGLAAVATADELDHPEWQAWSRGLVGWLLLEAGALDRAAVLLEEALAAGTRSRSAIMTLRAAAHLAHLHALAGDRSRARAFVRQATSVLDEVSAPAGRAYLQGADAPNAVAEALVILGRPDEALQLARPTERAATTAGWREHFASARLAIGAALEAAGERTGAAGAYRGAIDASDPDLPGAAWRAHARLARVGAGDDHAERAREIVHRLLERTPDATIAEGLHEALERELAREGRAR
jgi:tetratricopeptide (TPR) repeat protein